MGIFTGILMTIMMWWMIFLAILPWKGNPEGKTHPGCVKSAPARTYLRQKIIITTIFTAVGIALMYFLVKYEVISLDNIP